MFERNRVEQSQRDGIAVELTLEDGRVIAGRLLANITRGLAEELNAPGSFVEIEGPERERTFLSKSAIRSVKSMVVPKVESLDRRLKQGETLDPWQVLGIARTAEREQIRAAYYALAKAYHPDRLQSVGLPPEVLEYTNAMAKRVNAAYAMLGGTGAAPLRNAG